MSAGLAFQVYESPIAPKVSHAVEVMGSHNHLPINNVKGVGRHGKTGGSSRVRVGSIGSRVKTGHGSKRVIFKWVNRVTGQTGRGLSRVTSQVELTRIFQNFFFFLK